MSLKLPLAFILDCLECNSSRKEGLRFHQRPKPRSPRARTSSNFQSSPPPPDAWVQAMQAAESDDEEPGLPPGKLYPLVPPRLPPPELAYGGLAVHTFEDGSVYAGDWVRGMRSGWGVFTTADGVHYAGEWRTDCYDGLGIVTYASANRYEGEFLADQRHGRGLFLWKTTVRGECER